MAAHDTVRSISTVQNELDFVIQIGDISYGRGNEAVWNEFFDMIEPVASMMPWSVIPGNHDMKASDSSGECGVPMLARSVVYNCTKRWRVWTGRVEAETDAGFSRCASGGCE